MPIRVILRKADLEILALADEYMTSGTGALSNKQEKLWSAFYERVLAAEMKPKKKGGGLTVSQAVETLQGVLPKRLVLPASWPNPGGQWFAQLQNRINASGLTAAHIKAAGQVAAAQWKGPIKAESIIRQTDVLLSDANMEKLGLEAPEPAHDMTEL